MADIKHLNREQKKTLFLSALGGVLEFYDFIIYVFLANILEKLFFAGGSEFVSTLKTLAVFSIGYLIRPLGGVVFAHFGDRYGRKIVFYITVLLMAVPAFGIALLPTQAQIGVLAPILLLILRMMQGLALGGEIPASITFVAEHVDSKHRGFATAILFFGVNIGLLLGSLVTTIMSTVLSEQAIYAYGWRLPFFLGGIFGVLAIFLRRYLKETAAFAALHDKEKQRIPFLTVMQYSWVNVLQGFFLVALVSMTIFMYLYWPLYLTRYMNFDHGTILRINTMGTLILSLSILLGGWLGDRFGIRKIYEIGAVLIVLLSYPLFLLFGMQSIALVVVSYILFSLMFGFVTGSFSSLLSTLFETPVRYSGIAVSYNLAYGLVGGLSPVVCTLIIYAFNTIYAPVFYLMFVAGVSFIACILGRRTSISLPPDTEVAANVMSG